MSTNRHHNQSHQNKTHNEALRTLTLRFEQMNGGNMMSDEDRELGGYFSTLYKNSNKGIKGRGKEGRTQGGKIMGHSNIKSEDSSGSQPSP